MKKINIYPIALLAVALVQFASLNAQTEALKYRRSSLHLVLLESDKFPNKETVIKSYTEHPFPDKYNKHSVGKESIAYKLTENDLRMGGFLKDTLKDAMKIMKAVGNLKTVKYLNEEKTIAVVVPNGMDSAKLKIDKHIKESSLAKMLVAKWLNKKEDGSFDFELIRERGMYSPSNESADQQIQGVDDSDLIGNTFVVFNKMNFYPNEPVAKLVLDAALIEAGKITVEMAKQKAIEKAKQAYERMKEGYTVITSSFLYKLVWDQPTIDKFNVAFMSKTANTKLAWDTSNFFKLAFVGKETNTSLVTMSLKVKRTLEQTIKLAVDRNIDGVYSKLQKEYVVFRPVSPIISGGDTIRAKIGLKEGIEPGQTFEILELKTIDKKLGTQRYVSIGKTKVNKKMPVWDNRAGAMEEPELDKDGKPVLTPEYTTFSGAKGTQPGMHFIRLIK
jgi:hypothetical protein